MIRTSSRQGRGFTMIEVTITIVLLVVLATVGVSALRAVIDRSGDAAASATLDRAITAQRSFSNAYGSYASEPSDLKDLGRDLTVVLPPQSSTSTDVLSMAVGTKGTLVVAIRSKSGKCLLRSVTPLLASSKETASVTETSICLATDVLPPGESPRTPQTLR